MAKKGSTQTVARSSKTGKFVKKSYAKTHPAMTEVERVKKPDRKEVTEISSHNGQSNRRQRSVGSPRGLSCFSPATIGVAGGACLEFA